MPLFASLCNERFGYKYLRRYTLHDPLSQNTHEYHEFQTSLSYQSSHQQSTRMSQSSTHQQQNGKSHTLHPEQLSLFIDIFFPRSSSMLDHILFCLFLIPMLITFLLISQYWALRKWTLHSLEWGLKKVHHSIILKAMGGFIITTFTLWIVAHSGIVRSQ